MKQTKASDMTIGRISMRNGMILILTMVIVLCLSACRKEKSSHDVKEDSNKNQQQAILQSEEKMTKEILTFDERREGTKIVITSGYTLENKRKLLLVKYYGYNLSINLLLEVRARISGQQTIRQKETFLFMSKRRVHYEYFIYQWKSKQTRQYSKTCRKFIGEKRV